MFGRAERLLWALRASMQAAERPCAASPRCSQIESCPVSWTSNSGLSARASSQDVIACGSQTVLPRATTLPSWLMTQIEISLSDTSRPAYVFIVLLLSAFPFPQASIRTSLAIGERPPQSHHVVMDAHTDGLHHVGPLTADRDSCGGRPRSPSLRSSPETAGYLRGGPDPGRG